MPEFSLSEIVYSVINSDGTVTISPSTGQGNVTISLNLANANTWSALQSFGNYISIGGAQVNVATLANGQALVYNSGTNQWVNTTVQAYSDLIVATNMTISSSATYNSVVVTNSATLTIQGGVTITATVFEVGSGATCTTNNATLAVSGVANIAGTLTSSNALDSITFSSGTTSSGAWSIAGTVTLPTSTTSTFSGATLAGTGTVSIASGATLTVGGNCTYTLTTLSGSGTLVIASTYTLTLGSSEAIAIGNIGGPGTLALSTFTLTINSPTSLTVTVSLTLTDSGGTITGTGTLGIAGSQTLTLSNNITLNVAILTGGGTVACGSTTVTVGNAVTWSNLTFSGAFTISATSQTITIGQSSQNVNWSCQTLSTATTISVANGSTLTQQTNTLAISNSSMVFTGLGTLNIVSSVSVTTTPTWSIANYTGAGSLINNNGGSLNLGTNSCNFSTANVVNSAGLFTLTVNSGITITFTGTTAFSSSALDMYITGAGAVAITGILNVTTGVITHVWNFTGGFSGAGTLSISSGTIIQYTPSSANNYSLALISGSGTWTMSGSGTTTITLGYTCRITAVKGTWSAPLQVNGVFVLPGGCTAGTTDAVLTAPFSGTIAVGSAGLIIASCSTTAGTSAVTFTPSGSPAAGANFTGSATGAATIAKVTITTITTSIAGIASLGITYSSGTYRTFIWLKTGGTSAVTLGVSYVLNDSAAHTAVTDNLRNVTGGTAGTVTLGTATVYV